MTNVTCALRCALLDPRRAAAPSLNRAASQRAECFRPTTYRYIRSTCMCVCCAPPVPRSTRPAQFIPRCKAPLFIPP
eukprot:4856807-Pleurochrysis_carterae.AAC.3